MPKIIEATCTVKRTVQVVQYEPEEAFVAIKLQFDEGEEMDASDLDNALDQARDAVYRRLGIVDDSTATVVEDRVETVSRDTSAGESEKNPTSATARNVGRRGSGSQASNASSATETQTVQTQSSPSSGRRRVANPTSQQPAVPENTSNAAPATGGSRRRGSSAGQTAAATSAQDATQTLTNSQNAGSVKDLKQSDVSKAVSELGRAKTNKAAFELLSAYGVDRADQVPKEKWAAFIEDAIRLATA